MPDEVRHYEGTLDSQDIEISAFYMESLEGFQEIEKGDCKWP